MRPFPERSVSPAWAKTVCVLAMVALAACDSAKLPTEVQPRAVASNTGRDAGGGELTVMTYNIYQGTELENSIAATTPLEFVIGAAKDFAMMRQTNFSERAGAIATEIGATEPDLIGLQEVALWRTGVSSNPSVPATAVEQDFLQILLDALEARGLRYVAVASVNDFDVQGPALFSFGFMDVRLTDRNVILAQADELDGDIALSNPQSANFTTNLVIQTVGGPVTILEGWASIDVQTRGRSLRFVTTHLDAFSPLIRLAQANELLAGPANTSLPVILAGDMNTTSTTTTYAAFRGAGFVDLWPRLHRSAPGFTCCQVLPTISNSRSTLSERIDLVLVRGGLEPESIRRVGATPASRTPSGLWPSDHAGLLATLEFALSVAF